MFGCYDFTWFCNFSFENCNNITQASCNIIWVIFIHTVITKFTSFEENKNIYETLVLPSMRWMNQSQSLLFPLLHVILCKGL
jgi:hypothetical protein